MPELPEVETVMRGMETSLCGKNVKDVRVNRYDLRTPVNDDFALRLTGNYIKSFTRRGKYIIMEFNNDKAHVILHLGMSGRIRIFEAGEPYVPKKHDHIIFHMNDSSCFTYEDPRRFGLMYIASQDNWRDEKRFTSMGPEPLEKWDADNLLVKLKNKKANIKTALLDQRVVAGLGNIYVCEALYYAKVSPIRKSCTITRSEAEKIVINCKSVLEKAIKAGGSTLKDYQHTDGSLGYFQHSFSVYDQKDKPCANDDCTEEILRIVQAGRSTFYCPECQK